MAQASVCWGLALLLSACSGPGYAPVSERSLKGAAQAPSTRSLPTPAIYRVRQGDTLYSIAWRYGKDFRLLARANGIGDDYRIYPGQTLRLVDQAPAVAKQTPNSTPENKPATGGTSSATPKSDAVAPRVPIVKAVPKPTSSPPPVAKDSKPAGGGGATRGHGQADAAIDWRWPAAGRVVGGFRSGGKVNNGLDIAGARGSPVFAAADGRVVYAGSGLLGYGNLIIINHNQQYLSAYAHNSRLLVKENQDVSGGEKIAEIGNSGATRTMLHFEIRKDGKPVNPLHYLPKK